MKMYKNYRIREFKREKFKSIFVLEGKPKGWFRSWVVLGFFSSEEEALKRVYEKDFY